MNAVFVVGFYDPVKAVLELHHREHLKSRAIIWIGQKSPGREANLTDLATTYSDVIRAGATSILVLLAVPRGREFVVIHVEKIMSREGSACGVRSRLEQSENAGARDWVLQHIADFDLPSAATLSCENIRARTPAGKILCMSLDGNTSILDALKRAGFPSTALETFFEEERIKGARNSGLMEHLKMCAKKYGYLLYAFQGLRTLTPEVKESFERCYEAPTASKVAEMARRWLEGD